MLIHDVALLRLHVVLGVDRAGLVGEDGETHHGVFDIAYLGAVPGMTVLVPRLLRARLEDMLERALFAESGPVAVRYPRGGEGEYREGGAQALECLCEGGDVCIAAYGTMINEALGAARALEAEGISARVLKIGRVLPLEAEPLLAAARDCGRLVVAEEVCASGCIGGRILAAAGGQAGFKSPPAESGRGHSRPGRDGKAPRSGGDRRRGHSCGRKGADGMSGTTTGPAPGGARPLREQGEGARHDNERPRFRERPAGGQARHAGKGGR